MVEHKITIKGDQVIKLPARKWPHHLEGALTQEVKTMLDLGAIKPSASKCRRHPVMVPKPDGSISVSGFP